MTEKEALEKIAESLNVVFKEFKKISGSINQLIDDTVEILNEIANNKE